METETPMWTPSSQRSQRAAMTTFVSWVENEIGRRVTGYPDLHKWSIDEPQVFWALVWRFCSIVGDSGSVVASNLGDMFQARFYPDATLNFAENLLWKRGSGDAVVFVGEDRFLHRLSHDQLRDEVSRYRQMLEELGLRKGDRVAALVANTPEAVISMLAATSLGAIWCSCSPDFGVRAAIDRFIQVKPKLLIAVGSYLKNGELIDIRANVRALRKSLPTVFHTLVLDYDRESSADSAGKGWISVVETLKTFSPHDLVFEHFPFNHPLFILFSSGTTGPPKCIMHGAGGTLLQHKKEHQLHCDIKGGDRVLFTTTCGWMMWNWMVSALGSGATIVLYDGSPFYPYIDVLFDVIDMENLTFFGTSASVLDALRKSKCSPRVTHDLANLRTLASTGSPLSKACYEWVYSDVKEDVHLASISGGTDIISCFVLGVPTEPVWSGEIQGPGLGMAVDVWSETGRSAATEKGQLVCTRAFPSRPLGFWNDSNSERYHTAYYERFPGVWHHGDFAQWTAHRGIIIHGRSDTALNRNGIRIGTAEIYSVVQDVEEVSGSVCIDCEIGENAKIFLFVKLSDNHKLDGDLVSRLKRFISDTASPNHVPDMIWAVSDIPLTRSGKIAEVSVRDIFHGEEPNNITALSNPASLDEFRAIFRRVAEMSPPM